MAEIVKNSSTPASSSSASTSPFSAPSGAGSGSLPPARSELSRRVSTALMGVAVFLVVLLFGGNFGSSLIACVLSLAMMHEFVTMTFSLADRVEKQWALLGVVWLIEFFNYWSPQSSYGLLLTSFLGVFTYFLFTVSRHTGEAYATHFKELMFSIFGLIYVVFLPLFFPLLRSEPNGLSWVMTFLIIVWASDIGAYFAGKKWGRRKLFEAVSPKKTWEGSVGGLVCSWAAVLIFKLLIFKELTWGSVFCVTLVISVSAQVGDLCESFLKRAFHIKDSGSFLPGHGGFLDRFDGVVFALPVMYLCARVFS